MKEKKIINTDVFVCGTGPSGISAAFFLSRYGIKVLAITQYSGYAHTPRAHITNQRTMEILRDQGLEKKVENVAIPQGLMGDHIWTTSFADPEIVRFEAWGNRPERRAEYDRASPAKMCNIGQHLLEPIIGKAAIEAGADVRFKWKLIDLHQNDKEVICEVLDIEHNETYEVHAKYVIGADGGNSTVVKKMGFELSGEGAYAHAVSCWLEADLTKYVEHRPSVLYWLVQPGSGTWFGSGTYICVTPWKEWVLLFSYNPKMENPIYHIPL